MREVGVRQLKASLSETLREVAGGEHVRVTSRGKVIADIVPAAPAATLDQVRALVAEGRLTPAARARPPRAPRLARAREGLASARVLAERDAER